MIQQTYQFLTSQINIDNPDDFYEELINAHENLTNDESQKFNAKLIMVLANHIGDRDVLTEALDCVKNSYTRV
ncbi:DUF2783 domain-containing protein [Alteromonas gilva]|uniref:DUF2783 domain-containing protein n=1 Tax=Alteromonas gilva TaxID=2987522 RepID=A0ABT5KZR9_9ALTE|nr:DUF2783 domain-containing protein [Alteromonas gilva]MDC8830260.1 DUF2783 domain-containing protein [Alteromonas gilva]